MKLKFLLFVLALLFLGDHATARVPPPSASTSDVLPPPASTGDILPPPSASTGDILLPPSASTGDILLPPSASTSDVLPPPASTGDILPPPSASTSEVLPPPASTGDILPPPASTGDILPPPASTGDILPPPSASTDDILPPPSSTGDILRNYLLDHNATLDGAENLAIFPSLPQDVFELFFLPEPHAEDPNRVRHPHRTAELEAARNNRTLPDSVNWKARGAVNDPQNPGLLCRGGSHAFAVTSVLESAHFIQTGKLLNLSRQELLSCTHYDEKQEGPLGGTLVHEGMANCLWGKIEEDYKFIEKNGLRTEAEYPYEMLHQNSQCYLTGSNWTSIAVDGYTVLEDVDEEDIRALVAEHPVTAMIHGNCLKNYTRGTFTPSDNCTSGSPNLYVTIVGYGTDIIDGGGDYWLIRNTWGPLWGNHGYFQLKRNVGSLGINKQITWPNNVVVLTDQSKPAADAPPPAAPAAAPPPAPPAPSKSSAASSSALLLPLVIALFVLF